MPELNEILSMPYAERLNTIHRLRLLRNTTGELSAHTGIQLRNNSFSKKAPFIARSIYSEFSREVWERTNTDLDELLANYHKASHYFEKIAKTRKAQPEFHREVLRCLLNERFAASDEAQPYLASARAVAGLDEALLTLLVLEILPSFQAKPGDVDPNEHLEHIMRLREYFKTLYDECRLFRFAPYLTEIYQNAVRRIRGGELFSRLDMIHFAQEIVANLKNNYNPESLLQANQYINKHKIHPVLEQTVWTERDYSGKNPVYWKFEILGADYILIRREFDRLQKRITEIRYEVLLFQDDNRLSFQLIRQSEVESLCMGTPIAEHAYMYGSCHIDDLQTPQSIRWIFTTNCYDDFPVNLIRSNSDTYDKLARTATSEKWELICETGDYEYLPVERVITTNHIYVEHKRSRQGNGAQEIVSWYRIPREGLLQEVEIATPIARIRHDKRIYVMFIPLNRSFDVTDAETRARFGIQIVDRIVVDVPAKE